MKGNQLSGSAPALYWYSGEEPLEYVADCGGTSDDPLELTCERCIFCCNSEGKCYDNKTRKNPLKELEVIHTLTSRRNHPS
jgi:hypothetical protein